MKNSLFISYNASDLRIQTIQILDVTGKVMTVVNRNFNQIDISELATGTYILRLETGSGISTQRFIKE